MDMISFECKISFLQRKNIFLKKKEFLEGNSFSMVR